MGKSKTKNKSKSKDNKSKAEKSKNSSGSSSELLFLLISEITIVEGFNPRASLGALKSLVDSVKQNGVIENLVVWKDDDEYKLICGHRRIKAAEEAGLKEVPVTVRHDVEDENQALLIAVSENSADSRYNFTPIEEATAFKKLRDNGYSMPEIAIQSGISRSKIARSLKILELPERVQKNIQDSLLSANAAVEIANLPDKDRKAVVKNIDSIANKSQLDALLNKLSIKKKSDKIDNEYITKNRTNKDIKNAVLNFYDNYRNERRKKVQDNILYIIASLMWVVGDIDIIDTANPIFEEQLQFVEAEWDELEWEDGEDEDEGGEDGGEEDDDEDYHDDEYE